MICHCDYCHYTFDSAACHLGDSIPESCPDCGKTHISVYTPAVRKATEGEAAEYRHIREEILREEQKGQCDCVNVLKRIGLDELRIIYKEHIREDFPRGERRPLFGMEKLQKAGRYDCYGYYQEDSLVAYACYILTQNGSYALLDYFAVVPELRGKGIGSEFLRSLKGNASAKRGVFIEAESPDSAKTEEEKETRERRIRFYLSNGAERTNSKCMLFGVDYNIMFISTGDAVDTQEKEGQHHAVEELYRELYGRVYGKLCRPYCERNADHAPVRM